MSLVPAAEAAPSEQAHVAVDVPAELAARASDAATGAEPISPAPPSFSSGGESAGESAPAIQSARASALELTFCAAAPSVPYEPAAASWWIPRDRGELGAMVVEAVQCRLRIAARGGGVALGLGRPTPALDAWIDLRRLSGVVDYSPEDQVIEVESGMTLGALQTLVGQQGQCLGVDAPAPERATLGGLLAVGGFGPRRQRYGGLRELLLGATFLRADGEVARSGSRVVKNVAGFDLHKLHCGALGSLGIVSSLIVRLHPRPEHSVTLLTAPIDAELGARLGLATREVQLEPSSLVARREAQGHWRLAIRFEGFEAAAAQDVERFAEQVLGPLKVDAQRLAPDAASQYWAEHDRERLGGRLRIRLSTLPTDFALTDVWVAPLAGPLGEMQVFGYPSLGVIWVTGAIADLEAVVLGLERLRTVARAARGHLVVEQAPPELHEAFECWGPVPSSFALMASIKQRFDPQALFNPGRFVGGL